MVGFAFDAGGEDRELEAWGRGAGLTSSRPGLGGLEAEGLGKLVAWTPGCLNA